MKIILECFKNFRILFVSFIHNERNICAKEIKKIYLVIKGIS